MQDFCFKCASKEALLSSLEAAGIPATGDLLYAGRVVATPGAADPETGEVITAPVYLDGEYAVYRATDAVADLIEAATWPEGVEVIDPPGGLPRFGGEWLAPDLDVLKAVKIEEAKAACEAVLDPLGTEYGRWETATWDQQVAEATALMADPLASVPMLTAMASARGMEVAALAQRILVNRETWSAISGAVIGQRQAIYDQVKASGTVADVNSIVVNITLPT